MHFPFQTQRFALGLYRALCATTSTFAALIAGLVLSLGLMSCGGGGSGVSGGGTGGGGSPAPVSSANPASSFGSVSGLGSIFIGSYEFDDALGKVTAQDGFPVRASELGLGIQVSVFNEKTSQTLALDANNSTSSIQVKRMFMGVLRANAGVPETALINGQVVYFDRRTVIVGAKSSTSLIGALVQVSGYLEPALNHVIATRVEPATPEQTAQNEIYLTARVESVDKSNASVSVGFATVSLAKVGLIQPVQVDDIIRVQGSLSAGSTTTVLATKLTQVKPVSGFGGSTFRGVVYSRPTATAPNTPLMVDGYEVQLPVSVLNALTDLRRGSLVEVRGLLENITLKNAELTIISNPKVTAPNEDPVTGKPGDPPGSKPRPDYLIYKSPIQSVDVDGSFMVRGLRVVPYLPAAVSTPRQVGQVITISGEARTDASGLYILAEIVSVEPI